MRRKATPADALTFISVSRRLFEAMTCSPLTEHLYLRRGALPRVGRTERSGTCSFNANPPAERTTSELVGPLARLSRLSNSPSQQGWCGWVKTHEAILSRLRLRAPRKFFETSTRHLTTSASANMANQGQETVYVITGGNRGIGFGLLQALLARPFTKVIVTVRNAATREALYETYKGMKKGDHSELTVLLMDLANQTTPDELRSNFTSSTGGISKVDVLISSAGHVDAMGTTLDTTADALQKHFQINTIGPLTIFQALWPLMKRPHTPTETAPAEIPKAFFISSSVGSIEAMEPVPGGAYGPSKAALNWIVKSLHMQLEHSGLFCAAVHPGWVQTPMGEFAAKAWKYDGPPPMTVEQSVQGILKLIDGADRSIAGKFVSYDGTILPW